MSNNIYLKLNLEVKEDNKKEISIYFLGNIYNNKLKKISLDEIYNLYINYGKRIYNYIDGVFSLVIKDNRINKIFVFQDPFGCNQSIYFYKKNKILFISSQLKKILLQNEKEKWEFNNKAIKVFLKKGYIPNKKTLVKGINKIPSKRYLEINIKTGKINLKRYRYKKIKFKENVTKEIYNKVFERVCTSSIDNDINITLSSGYDTNYILYTLNNNTKKEITAFSIGGKIGRNEVPDAEKISNYYNNVKFYSKLVDGASLNCYPEIVWALEGAVYESGIFLQYELAKLIKDYGKSNIILGECADQVLDYELYHHIPAFINKVKFCIPRLIKKIVKNIDYKPNKDTYDMASYKIIKKNGILMNYFEINPEYPYLKKDFVEIAKKVVKIGEKEKQYHKNVISSLLPDEVINILKKIGGATELKTLFIGDIKLEAIKEICKKNRFYKAKNFDDEFYEVDYFMKLIYLELFEKIFFENEQKFLKKTIKRFDLQYFFPELKLKKNNVDEKEKI